MQSAPKMLHIIADFFRTLLKSLAVRGICGFDNLDGTT